MLVSKIRSGGLHKRSLLGLFCGVLFLFLVFSTLASQKTFAAPYDEATPKDQAYAFMYFNALSSCMEADFDSIEHISADPAQVARGVFATAGSMVAGVSIKSDNGSVECNDSSYTTAALQLFGYTDNIQAYCDVFQHAGVKRVNNSDCVNGNGNFYLTVQDAPSSFRQVIGEKYFGNPTGKDLTGAAKYALWQETFSYYCKATPVKTTASATPSEKAQGGGNNGYTVQWFDASTRSVSEWIVTTQLNRSDTIEIYTSDGEGNYVEETCEKISTWMGNDAPAFAAWLQANPDVEIVGPAAPGSEAADSCDIFGDSALRWMLCPLFKLAVGFTSWLESIIQHLLSYDMTLLDKDGGMHQSWKVFRNLGLTLLIIAALIMVISQVLSLGFVDAYTIKKVLPRILIAAIGISLSWEITSFFVAVFNDLGSWIGSIIKYSFGLAAADNGDSNYIWNAVVTGAGVAGIGTAVATTSAIPAAAAAVASVGSWGFPALVILGVIAFALVVGLAVLGIRVAILSAAIIIAPLAIASWILPGTKKLWDFWQNTFMTVLLMYPIVMGFIAMGAGLAYVLAETNQSVLLGMLVYFAPFFLLPFAFKLAGGLMKTIFSITDDKSKGVFDRARNFRKDRKGAKVQEQIDGKTGGMLAGIRRASHASRHGGSAWGDGYSAFRNAYGKEVDEKALKEAGSLGQNDEINSRVASGIGRNDFERERSEEILTTKNAAFRRAHGMSETGPLTAPQQAQMDAALPTLRRDSERQARLEASMVEAKYGQFGSQRAMDIATRAKLSSASAYNNLNPDGTANAEADYQELYSDVSRMVARGGITPGDGLGMMKAYMQNRPDMKGASAGLTLNSLEEAGAALRSGGPALSQETLQNIQTSALRNMDSRSLLGADARSARNMAPVILDQVTKRKAAYDALKGSNTAQEAAALRAYKSSLATMANVHDGLSSTTEEVRTHYSNILDQNIGSNGPNMLAEIERLRTDAEFQQFRREYGRDPATLGGGGTPETPEK